MRSPSGTLLGRPSLLAAILLLACEAPPPTDGASRQPAAPGTQAPGTPVGHRERVNSGRVYVPAHSHIYTMSGTPNDLAVTLSIHNVSIERELVVDEVRYYDTTGKMLQEYLPEPIALAPLQTVEYFVPIKDRRGGSGANFVVGWHADSPVVRPLVEAVMIHTQGPQGFAFVSSGVEIRTDASLPKDAAEDTEPTAPDSPAAAAAETGE